VRFPKKFTSLYYAHFAMGVATSAQGTIDLTLDESDPQIAASVQMGLADAVMNLGEGGPIDVKTRELYGVTVRFIDSFAPAIMGMVVAIVCTILTLLSVVQEKATVRSPVFGFPRYDAQSSSWDTSLHLD